MNALEDAMDDFNEQLMTIFTKYEMEFEQLEGHYEAEIEKLEEKQDEATQKLQDSEEALNLQKNSRKSQQEKQYIFLMNLQQDFILMI